MKTATSNIAPAELGQRAAMLQAEFGQSTTPPSFDYSLSLWERVGVREPG